MLIILLNFFTVYLFNFITSKNKKILRYYLTYHNITMIILFSLFVFGMGGFLSFNISYNFSNQQTMGEDLFLPYYFISCFCIVFIFTPALYVLMRHNAVSLWILNMICKNEYDPVKMNQFKELFYKENYCSHNPYYREMKKNMSQSFDEINRSYSINY